MNKIFRDDKHEQRRNPRARFAWLYNVLCVACLMGVLAAVFGAR